ncbi:DUF6233 domain-containing protein [Streptomyces sp. NBC_01373]|uniref:DUF6233 domain-containing protein n=1 Tax=Streptomyces sp. NBC_01373 TaxID=2903843 RepID=UPI0022577DF2|nr:DUF6233 domain-containing protein [Streptomyces sp. NBC_01373]MCX4704387.1 DUF6233 domain-containing protein [Streptomyces sp. NBC_01373]MCX4707127.1 DUF6233 domain-containing protein [Streptomyces sp. NBC_01373]
MHDLPPDLPRLRTLETWLQLNLAQVRQAIAAAEQREAERQRGIEHRPPTPDWMIQYSLGGRHPLHVHTGGCHMAGPRPKGVTREAALRALADGVTACSHCRPDSELGFLEG